MICITGNERSLEALSARLDAHPEALHEVRLDYLANVDDEVFERLKRDGGRLVVACRRAQDRGGYGGNESDRLALLRRAQASGARYVDVESDVNLASFSKTRLIVSEHDFEGGVDAAARLRALRDRAPVVKLAVMVEDASELEALLTARQAIAGDAIVIGMGTAGLLSRARHQAFGSVFTYVPASADSATAPGQINLATFAHQGLDDQTAPFCALAGGPQVVASPGPRLYPPLFRRRGFAARAYLPVVTRSLARTLPLLERLGCVGVSVTMPLKREAAEIAGLVTPAVERIGAANSLRRRTHWEATNTDVAGVRGPLLAHVKPGQHALVLGAGGAAAAAVDALVRLGLEVAVSARRRQAVEALAARFGATAIDWDDREKTGAEVVVNATPIAGDESPWPDDSRIDAVVLDMAFGHNSRLARQSRHYLDAMTMWVAQGAAQIGWFFDADVAPSEVRGRA